MDLGFSVFDDSFRGALFLGRSLRDDVSFGSEDLLDLCDLGFESRADLSDELAVGLGAARRRELFRLGFRD